MAIVSGILDKFRLQSSKKFIPMQASLELTYRCNERCTHCYIDDFSDDSKRVLALEDWTVILRKLKAAGTLYIILMGGEAMLNHHFFAIAKEASELGMHVSVITNGLKIKTEQDAIHLKEVGIRFVTFSLYSLDAGIHDQMTAVSGSHARTMRALELCRQQQLEVGVNCLLTQKNITGFFELADWCLERKIQIKEDVTVTPKFNGDMTTVKLAASEDLIRWYFREKSRRWPKGRPLATEEQAHDYVCNLAKGKCAITPYGEMLGCIEIRQPLGNLVTQEFSDIWYSQRTQLWRNLKVAEIKNYTKSQSCEGSFCEHCPGMALHESGDPMQMTAQSLRLARIKEEIYRENNPRADSFPV